MKSGFSTVLSGTGQNVQPVLCTAKRSACSVHGKGKFHSSAPLHCAVTADAGLPLFTRERAGAAGSFGVSAAA